PSQVQVLDDVTKLLPDDTWITQLEVKSAPRGKEPRRELLLRGESANAGRLVSLLEESKVFVDAAPRSPTTKIQPGPGEIFDLGAQLAPTPPPAPVQLASSEPANPESASSAVPAAAAPPAAAGAPPPVPAASTPPATPPAAAQPTAPAAVPPPRPAPPAFVPQITQPVAPPGMTAPREMAPPPGSVSPPSANAPPTAVVGEQEVTSGAIPNPPAQQGEP